MALKEIKERCMRWGMIVRLPFLSLPYNYLTCTCKTTLSLWNVIMQNEIIHIPHIFLGYSTVFCKIRDFICTSLRSTEIVLDER